MFSIFTTTPRSETCLDKVSRFLGHKVETSIAKVVPLVAPLAAVLMFVVSGWDEHEQAHCSLTLFSQCMDSSLGRIVGTL